MKLVEITLIAFFFLFRVSFSGNIKPVLPIKTLYPNSNHAKKLGFSF
jgi:hypothetical protein